MLVNTGANKSQIYMIYNEVLPQIMQTISFMLNDLDFWLGQFDVIIWELFSCCIGVAAAVLRRHAAKLSLFLHSWLYVTFV